MNFARKHRFAAPPQALGATWPAPERHWIPGMEAEIAAVSKTVKAHRFQEARETGGYPIEKAQIEARQSYRDGPALHVLPASLVPIVAASAASRNCLLPRGSGNFET
jgi:hypothetical protein